MKSWFSYIELMKNWISYMKDWISYMGFPERVTLYRYIWVYQSCTPFAPGIGNIWGIYDIVIFADALTRFSESQLRQHQWEWVVKDKDWLPIYKYQQVTTISDIWDKWAQGLHGFLSVRDLTERWGARWRRNDAGQRTESSRRKKVIDLVTELSSKHLWNVSLALRFLQERYEPRYKARGFCDYLTKENKNAVLRAAISYSF